eukprot:6190634-Pleurochrysis_carterae.AAC.1
MPQPGGAEASAAVLVRLAETAVLRIDKSGTWERVLAPWAKRGVLEKAAALANEQRTQISVLQKEVRKRKREAEAAIAKADRRDHVAEELRRKHAHERTAVGRKNRVLCGELEARKSQLKAVNKSLADAEKRARASAHKLLSLERTSAVAVKNATNVEQSVRKQLSEVED